MLNWRNIGILFLSSCVAISLQLHDVNHNDFESRMRFNFSFPELKHTCDSEVTNISHILRNLNDDFSTKLSEISKYLWDLSVPETDTISWDKIPSFQLIKSRCYEKSELDTFFKDLIIILQVCFGDSLQLKTDEIQILAKSAAAQICSYLELDSLLTITDKECIQLINDNKDCFPSLNNMTGEYNSSLYNLFLNLKLDHSVQECRSFSNLWDCQNNVIQYCKNSSITMHKIWMTNRKLYLGCKDENSKVTKTQSTIIDVEKGRFNFTIPELIRVCESKGINLKENTKQADFHVFDIFLVCSGKMNLQNLQALPYEVINCMRKHCYTNYTLQSSFEKIIDSIQFCFDDADQISLQSKQNLAQTSVLAFCDKMLMGELAFHDSASTHRSWKNCYEKLENPEEELTNFFVLLSVPHIYTKKQCSFYAGFFACAQNEFEKSSEVTKAAIETVRLRLSNCD